MSGQGNEQQGVLVSSEQPQYAHRAERAAASRPFARNPSRLGKASLPAAAAAAEEAAVEAAEPMTVVLAPAEVQPLSPRRPPTVSGSNLGAPPGTLASGSLRSAASLPVSAAGLKLGATGGRDGLERSASDLISALRESELRPTGIQLRGRPSRFAVGSGTPRTGGSKEVLVLMEDRVDEKVQLRGSSSSDEQERPVGMWEQRRLRAVLAGVGLLLAMALGLLLWFILPHSGVSGHSLTVRTAAEFSEGVAVATGASAPTDMAASVEGTAILVRFATPPLRAHIHGLSAALSTAPATGGDYTFYSAEAVPEGGQLGGQGRGFGGGNPSATGNGSPIVISVGLQRGIAYTVYVTAHNSAGDSDPVPAAPIAFNPGAAS